MKTSYLAASAALFAATTVLAHGPQIQITRDTATGKIQTREIVSTNSAPTTISSLKRVYVMPMLPSNTSSGTEWFIRPDATPNVVTGLPSYTSSPGLAYQFESFVAGSGWAHSGSSSLPNLQGSNFILAFNDGLKQWNGATFVDPGTEQIQMFRGSTSSPAAQAITSDSSPFSSLALAAVGATASANPHHTVLYRMLGDGSSTISASDDGVYMLTLQAVSGADGVLASDPFHYIFYKSDGHLFRPEHNDLAEALEAAASLGFDPSLIQTYALVPEPAAMGVLALAAGAVLRRRK